MTSAARDDAPSSNQGQAPDPGVRPGPSPGPDRNAGAQDRVVSALIARLELDGQVLDALIAREIITAPWDDFENHVGAVLYAMLSTDTINKLEQRETEAIHYLAALTAQGISVPSVVADEEKRLVTHLAAWVSEHWAQIETLTPSSG
jgi:hypothetical protein